MNSEKYPIGLDGDNISFNNVQLKKIGNSSVPTDSTELGKVFEESAPVFEVFKTGDLTALKGGIQYRQIYSAIKSLAIFDKSVDSSLYYYKLAFLRNTTEGAFKIYKRLKTGSIWTLSGYFHLPVNTSATKTVSYNLDSNYSTFHMNISIDWSKIPIGFSQNLEADIDNDDPLMIIKQSCVRYNERFLNKDLDFNNHAGLNLLQAQTRTAALSSRFGKDLFPVFIRYTNRSIDNTYDDNPDAAYVSQVYAAFKYMKITGVDDSLIYKISFLRRNDSGTWSIMLNKKEAGVWSRVLYQSITGLVENAEGVTKFEVSEGSITLTSYIDFNEVPDGTSGWVDGGETNEPAFIINPLCYSKSTGGTSYDQSLNTTDDVEFASINAGAVEISGALPTGTLASPPAGLVVGDYWTDTTDSATHPIIRQKIS